MCKIAFGSFEGVLPVVLSCWPVGGLPFFLGCPLRTADSAGALIGAVLGVSGLLKQALVSCVVGLRRTAAQCSHHLGEVKGERMANTTESESAR
jgi:hypothetical protein